MVIVDINVRNGIDRESQEERDVRAKQRQGVGRDVRPKGNLGWR